MTSSECSENGIQGDVDTHAILEHFDWPEIIEKMEKLYGDNKSSISECVDDNKESDTVEQQLYQVLVPALFIAIIIIGTLGNCLVIYVILSQAKLRTVTNLLLLNLALSDVAFLLICGSFSVAHYVLTEWPFGAEVCLTIQYLLYVTCYVTVYTLVAVSVVRYISVVHGAETRCCGAVLMNRCNAVIMIVLLWLVFLLAKIPILMVHGITYNNKTNRLECIISGKVEGQQLFGAFFVFAYVLPLTVIATLSILIVRHLRSQSSVRRQEVDRHSHVTRVLSIVVLTFAVCWLPLHGHLLAAYYGSIPDTLTYKLLIIIWHGLIYINSMLNPIIYNCFSKEFRDSFRKAVLCRKSQGPEDYQVC